MNWQQRRVLVTGGTRGIGRELVLGLLSRGAQVVATGASESTTSQAAASLPQVQWLTCDLRSPDSLVQLANSVGSEPFSDVIHNAGVQQSRDFAEPGLDELISVRDEVAINLIGAIELTRLLLPALRQSPNLAHLVFVTSGLALAPKRSSPVYCATKAGLRSFAKALRGQMRRTGDRVRIIEALPPIVDTDMTRGRGSRKMNAAAAAAQILSGIESGKDEIYVGASALLKWILRISPALGERIMINR